MMESRWLAVGMATVIIRMAESRDTERATAESRDRAPAVDFTSVDLTCDDLTSVDLTNVDLTSVDLTSVGLSSVDLTRVDLTSVVLTRPGGGASSSAGASVCSPCAAGTYGASSGACLLRCARLSEARLGR